MAIFDQDTQNYPKSWKEYSLEFKLMFAYHLCMMALFIVGSALNTGQQLAIAAGLIGAFTLVSLARRSTKGWQWRGAGWKEVLAAAGTILLMGVFLFAATPLFPPSDARHLPWYLAGFGIGLFGVLGALRLVHMSESDFLADCGTPESPMKVEEPARPIDPLWKRITRGLYTVAFLFVWLCGVGYFYLFGVAFQNGSPEPTATHTERINNHGEVRYIPPEEKRLLDNLQVVMFAGIPLAIASGLALHFVVGVKMFPDTPTLWEYLRKRGS